MPGRVFTQTAARRRSLRAWDWHPPDLGRPSDPSGLRAPNLGGAPPTSRQRRADAHPGASSRTPLGEREDPCLLALDLARHGDVISPPQVPWRQMDRKRKRRRTKLHYRQDRRDPSRTEELAEFLENTSPPPSQRVARASRRSSPTAARGGKTGWEGESC